jgi:hypothetical protein
MSVVTSIIILFPYSEDERDRIAEINAFEFNGRKYDFHWIDENDGPDSPSNCYSGTKSFNGVVLLASYNNFPEEAFLRFISSAVKWLDEDAVQILIKSEKHNDRSFRVYSFAGKTLVSDSLKE